MSVRVGVTSRRRRSSRESKILLSVILGAVGIAGALIATRPPAAEARVEKVVVATFDTVRLPVPAALVPVGTRVQNIPLQFVDYPKHQVPKGALTTLENHLEAATTAPLPALLPIFAENLSHNATGSNPVIERIPDGMRAMTIRVDATAAVEGWAGSGATVDVLLVAENKTTVVAERVKILSAERSVAPVEGAAAPSVPTTVTLLVTQEQCLAINTAIPRGRIAFALRSTGDDGAWRDTTFSAERLHGGPPPKPSDIRGVVTSKGKTYALADGRWIESSTVPGGFMSLSKD